MANKRKQSSDSEFIPEPKRSSHPRNASGKHKSAPIDSEAILPQKIQHKGTSTKGAPKKLKTTDVQQAHHTKQMCEDYSKLASENVLESQEPPVAPKSKDKHTLVQPFPTGEQFATDDFPVFEDGDIVICLNREHSYLLHSSTMNRAGTFFKADATMNIDEPCEKMRVYEKLLDFGGMRRYEMIEREDGDGCHLVRKALTKVIPKSPVIAAEAVENKESVPSSMLEAQQVPSLKDRNQIAVPSEPTFAAPDASMNKKVIQNLAATGPVTSDANTITAATQQAPVLPGMATSQSTPVPFSTQTPGIATTAGVIPGLTAASSAPKVMATKQEDGFVVKEEPATETAASNASSSSTPGIPNQVGLSLDALPHFNGRPTIEMGGKTCYISAAIDSADPQQLRPKNTINIAGLDYQYVPVNPAPPTVLAAPESYSAGTAEEQAQKNEEENEEMEEEAAKVIAPNPCPPLTYADWVFGFHSFFLIVYNRPTAISSTDISLALRQCEALVAAAKSCGGLRVVLAHIGNSIMMFGKIVYTSIRDSPRRWLKFAVDLQHVAIFNEAMIHVVGQYPDWIEPATFSMFSVAAVELIQRKAAELRCKILDTNEKLFAASLEVGPNDRNTARVALDKDNTQSFDTWFIVQLWRSWYSDKLAEARVARIPENFREAINERFDIMVMMGALFRLLDEAGEAYLSKDKVSKLLDKYKAQKPKSHVSMTGFMDFLNWEVDLNKMKEFAKEALKPLMVNNSMLTPQEHGIQYLTCVTVAEDERPWEKV